MSSRWKLPALRSNRVAGAGLVTALVAGTLALAFGTGYVANEAVFSQSSAWLRDGDDATLVSAAGGTPDDSVAVGAGGEVTTAPDGSLGFTEAPTSGRTRTTSRYEPGDPTPTGTATIGARAHTVTSEQGTWVVDLDAGTVQARDLRTLAAKGGPIVVDGGIVADALGTDGRLWILDGRGRVGEVGTERLERRRSVELEDPSRASLAAVGDQPVVVDPVAGRVLAVGGDAHEVGALRGARVVVAPNQPGPWLVLVAVRDRDHTLVALDPTAGDPETADIGTDPVAAPLAVGADAYVPTVQDGTQRLRRFTLPGLAEADAVPLPETSDEAAQRTPADGDLGFDTFVVGTRIWANDPVSPEALTIGEQEAPDFVDKVARDASGDDGDAPADDEDDRSDEAPPEPDTPVDAPALPPLATPAPTPGTTNRVPADPGTGPATPTAPAGTPPASTPAATPPTTPPPAPVVVPTLTGQPFDDACADLARLQLACTPDAVPDADREEGEVYAQSPRAGAEVERGAAVTVTYAVWGSVDVPELGGLSPDQALVALQEVGLRGEPTARTDAAPTDVLDQVLDDSVSPAPRTEVTVNDTVRYEYFSEYAPVPYDPAWVLGQPGDQACPILATHEFRSCTPVVGDPAPSRAQAGLVYAVDPAAAGSYSPQTPVVATAYAVARSAPAGAFPNGCADVEAWAAANGVPGVTCQEVTGGPPGPYNGVTAQTPAVGTDLASGDQVTLARYQPAPVAVTDWNRISATGAAHTFRVVGTGAPEAADWEAVGAYTFLAGNEPGTAPVGCWVTRTYGTRRIARHYCGLAAPAGYEQSDWTPVDIGGTFHAWGADPGGARLLVSCELRRYEDGSSAPPVFLAQYFGTGTCATADPGPAGFTDRWEPGAAMWSIN